jgi:hypothetical protein
MEREGASEDGARRVWPLLTLAALLFTIALSVPHIPGWFTEGPLARTWGVGGPARGRFRWTLHTAPGAEAPPLDARTPIGDAERLWLRYDAGGLLYVRAVTIEPGGKLRPVSPSADDGAHPYGHRAEPGGGVLELALPSDPRLVLWLYFGAVPLQLPELQLHADRAADRVGADPVAIGSAMHPSGVAAVRVIERISGTGSP